MWTVHNTIKTKPLSLPIPASVNGFNEIQPHENTALFPELNSFEKNRYLKNCDIL